MLCDECLKNNATVHMTTFVNGQIKTVHLCGQCAAKRKQTAIIPGFSFNDFMSAFYDTDDSADVVCDICGTTLLEFKKTGRLGCANCYRVFETSILPVLKGIHMNNKHTGKRPGERLDIDIEKAEESINKKEELKKAMRMAISTENFEEAARLRDEIAILEKEGD
ncbi:MAG: UvrB/UvrC motif-containing protein [Eubacteriales bacterium]|nr:UvrB/UvrC motif-containing protein [Eubacteriales bacterium]